jgi:hypothetical protein
MMLIILQGHAFAPAAFSQDFIISGSKQMPKIKTNHGLPFLNRAAVFLVNHRRHILTKKRLKEKTVTAAATIHPSDGMMHV